MKVTVESLGRIERAEFDVRPLTVFVGPNNTNKSWAAFALAEAYRATSYHRDDDSIEFSVEDDTPEARATRQVEDVTSAPSWEETQRVVSREDAASDMFTFGMDEIFADVLGVDRSVMRDCRIQAVFDARDRSAALFDEVKLTLRSLGALIDVKATFAGAGG